MGLMLHAKGWHFIKNGKFKYALDILSMGEVTCRFLIADVLIALIQLSYGYPLVDVYLIDFGPLFSDYLRYFRLGNEGLGTNYESFY